MKDKELQEYVLEHFKWLHRHPELAMKEYQTTEYIKGVLGETEGVELLSLGLETGALAKIAGREEGPVIALRADIDGLPILEDSGVPYSSEHEGCMHACGHDFHTAALLGAAKILGNRRDELAGTVILLFQPAEEAAHGGEQVVQTGIFQREKIEKIFALHTRSGLPVGTIQISKGAFSAAVDRFTFKIVGSGCHGSAPQDGLDPIPAAARLVGSLQEIVSRRLPPSMPAVVSVTRFTSGTSWNIIPDSAELEGTVRSFSPDGRKLIEAEMRMRAKGLGQEGYEAEFQWIPGCAATNNDEKLAKLIERAAEKEGFQVLLQEPEMGGEDFSCYQELIPGALFHIGTGGAYPVHSCHFWADPEALAGAAGLMSRIAAEALRES